MHVTFSDMEFSSPDVTGDHSEDPLSLVRRDGFSPGTREAIITGLVLERERIREQIQVASNAHKLIVGAGLRIESYVERLLAIGCGEHFPLISGSTVTRYDTGSAFKDEDIHKLKQNADDSSLEPEEIIELGTENIDDRKVEKEISTLEIVKLTSSTEKLDPVSTICKSKGNILSGKLLEVAHSGVSQAEKASTAKQETYKVSSNSGGTDPSLNQAKSQEPFSGAMRKAEIPPPEVKPQENVSGSKRKAETQSLEAVGVSKIPSTDSNKINGNSVVQKQKVANSNEKFMAPSASQNDGSQVGKTSTVEQETTMVSATVDKDIQNQNLKGSLLTERKNEPGEARPNQTPHPLKRSYILFVRNLPWDVDATRLKQVVREHGKVVEVRVPYDRITGDKKGYGFVTMETEAEMNTAISKLNGQDLDGREIAVEKSRHAS